MLLPSLFNDRDWDHLMSESFDPFESWWTNRANNLMRTDIKSVDEGYELIMDLPGFAKDDISVSLSDGYLTVKADHEDKDETKDEKDDYIRRERYYGHLERSFYL